MGLMLLAVTCEQLWMSTVSAKMLDRDVLLHTHDSTRVDV